MFHIVDKWVHTERKNIHLRHVSIIHIGQDHANPTWKLAFGSQSVDSWYSELGEDKKKKVLGKPMIQGYVTKTNG